MPPWEVQQNKPLQFARAHDARKIYAVKSVQDIDLPWTRFEFVTPQSRSHLITKI
jgi:hypothetical protein